MNILKQALAKPTLGRVTYDWGVTFAAALLTLGLAKFVFISSDVSAMSFLWMPFGLVGLNFLLGIYGRLKSADFGIKIVLLTVALAATVGLEIFGLNGAWQFAFLWLCLAWAPLVLPRYFLNLKKNVSTVSLVGRAVQNRGPVLVVGGAGYIGTHVVEQLLKSGQAVRVLDRLTYGESPIHEYLKNPAFEFIQGDATDIVKLNTAINGCSAVVHLAGLVGDPACAVDENFTRHTNIIATRMVKEVAKSFGIPRLIFASSCSVYGVSNDPVNETSALNPVSLYAKTKIDSENELLLAQTDDFVVTILRFATVFGHSRRPRFDLVVNLFTAQAFVDGRITVAGPDQWRPFVHVRDLARAVVATLKADTDKVQGQIFNVGDDRLNTTIGALGNEVQKVISKDRAVEVVVNHDWKDLRNYNVSFKKISDVLKFRAETTIAMGIEEMVEEFKKGTFQAYRENSYSNLEMTKVALAEFNDPETRSRLYSPMS